MMDPSKECGPDCDPNSSFAKATEDTCGPEHSEDLPEPTPDIPPLPESRLTQVADTLVLVMFIVGAYSQIFSLFLYAFSSA